MTIKNLTMNTILTAFLLISHSYTLTMNHNSLATKEYLKKIYRAETKEDRLQYTINSGLLGTLPSETLKEALATISPLDVKIKTILALHATCKKFSALTFQDIAKICQSHTYNEKATLRDTIGSHTVDYWKKRAPFLILSLATNTKPCLNIFRDPSYPIVRANDIEAVKILNFTPKKAYKLLPYAQTPEMALQLFSISNVDLKDPRNTNILWDMFFYKNEKAVEMIEFYIENNVPLNTINANNKDCLLHTFIKSIWDIKDFEDKAIKTIKAIELITNACPSLTNIQNCRNKTPYDLACTMLNITKNLQKPSEKTITTLEKVVKILSKSADL